MHSILCWKWQLKGRPRYGNVSKFNIILTTKDCCNLDKFADGIVNMFPVPQLSLTTYKLQHYGRMMYTYFWIILITKQSFWVLIYWMGFPWGPRKTVLPGMAITMLKDKTSWRHSVWSLTWKSSYVDKAVFILRRGPGIYLDKFQTQNDMTFYT